MKKSLILLRGLPGTAGDQPAAEGRGARREPAHHFAQLHQLRTLHRRLLEECVFVHHALHDLAGIKP